MIYIFRNSATCQLAVGCGLLVAGYVVDQKAHLTPGPLHGRLAFWLLASCLGCLGLFAIFYGLKMALARLQITFGQKGIIVLMFVFAILLALLLGGCAQTNPLTYTSVDDPTTTLTPDKWSPPGGNELTKAPTIPAGVIPGGA